MVKHCLDYRHRGAPTLPSVGEERVVRGRQVFAGGGVRRGCAAVFADGWAGAVAADRTNPPAQQVAVAARTEQRES